MALAGHVPRWFTTVSEDREVQAWHAAGYARSTGVLPIALLFLLLLSVAHAPAAPPTPTPGPEGQTFSFPWPPDWVARGKYQKMVLRGVTGFNPGQWDVQACGILPGCLMPAWPAV